MFSVGCSTNLSSGDLDLCMVGRAGSLNSMVSLPPVTEKRRMDILCHHWSGGNTHPTQETGSLGEKAPSSIIDSAMVEKGQPTLSTVKAGQRGPGPAAYES